MEVEGLLPPGVDAATFAAIVGAMVMLGGVMKHAFPNVPNRLIPILLLVMGTGATVVMAEAITPRVFILSFVAVTTAIGTHQLVTQTANKPEL